MPGAKRGIMRQKPGRNGALLPYSSAAVAASAGGEASYTLRISARSRAVKRYRFSVETYSTVRLANSVGPRQSVPEVKRHGRAQRFFGDTWT